MSDTHVMDAAILPEQKNDLAQLGSRPADLVVPPSSARIAEFLRNVAARSSLLSVLSGVATVGGDAGQLAARISAGVNRVVRLPGAALPVSPTPVSANTPQMPLASVAPKGDGLAGIALPSPGDITAFLAWLERAERDPRVSPRVPRPADVRRETTISMSGERVLARRERQTILRDTVEDGWAYTSANALPLSRTSRRVKPGTSNEVTASDDWAYSGSWDDAVPSPAQAKPTRRTTGPRRVAPHRSTALGAANETTIAANDTFYDPPTEPALAGQHRARTRKSAVRRDRDRQLESAEGADEPGDIISRAHRPATPRTLVHHRSTDELRTRTGSQASTTPKIGTEKSVAGVAEHVEEPVSPLAPRLALETFGRRLLTADLVGVAYLAGTQQAQAAGTINGLNHGAMTLMKPGFDILGSAGQTNGLSQQVVGGLFASPSPVATPAMATAPAYVGQAPVIPAPQVALVAPTTPLVRPADAGTVLGAGARTAPDATPIEALPMPLGAPAVPPVSYLGTATPAPDTGNTTATYTAPAPDTLSTMPAPQPAVAPATKSGDVWSDTPAMPGTMPAPAAFTENARLKMPVVSPFTPSLLSPVSAASVVGGVLPASDAMSARIIPSPAQTVAGAFVPASTGGENAFAPGLSKQNAFASPNPSVETTPGVPALFATRAALAPTGTPSFAPVGLPLTLPAPGTAGTAVASGTVAPQPGTSATTTPGNAPASRDFSPVANNSSKWGDTPVGGTNVLPLAGGPVAGGAEIQSVMPTGQMPLQAAGAAASALVPYVAGQAAFANPAAGAQTRTLPKAAGTPDTTMSSRRNLLGSANGAAIGMGTDNRFATSRAQAAPDSNITNKGTGKGPRGTGGGVDPLLGQITLVAPPMTVASRDAEQSGAVLQMDWATLAKGSGPLDAAALARLKATLPPGAQAIYPALPPGAGGPNAVNLAVSAPLLSDILGRGYGPQAQTLAGEAAARGYAATGQAQAAPLTARLAPTQTRPMGSDTAGPLSSGTQGAGALQEAGSGDAKRGGAMDFVGMPVRLAPSLGGRSELAAETAARSAGETAPSVVRPEAFAPLRERLFPSFQSVESEPDKTAWRKAAPAFGIADASATGVLAPDARVPRIGATDPLPQLENGAAARSGPLAPLAPNLVSNFAAENHDAAARATPGGLDMPLSAASAGMGSAPLGDMFTAPVARTAGQSGAALAADIENRMPAVVPSGSQQQSNARPTPPANEHPTNRAVYGKPSFEPTRNTSPLERMPSVVTSFGSSDGREQTFGTARSSRPLAVSSPAMGTLPTTSYTPAAPPSAPVLASPGSWPSASGGVSPMDFASLPTGNTRPVRMAIYDNRPASGGTLPLPATANRRSGMLLQRATVGQGAMASASIPPATGPKPPATAGANSARNDVAEVNLLATEVYGLLKRRLQSDARRAGRL